MTRRFALLLAAGVTAFALVVAGGLAVRWPIATPREAVAATIAPDQAAAIALAGAPGAISQRSPELVRFRGQTAYEVQFDRGVVYVDATTGTILGSTASGAAVMQPAGVAAGQPVPGEAVVSREAAMHTAAAYLPGDRAISAKLEREHGVLAYEVELASGSEVYVDAESGEVVFAKVERSDRRGDSRRTALQAAEHDDD